MFHVKHQTKNDPDTKAIETNTAVHISPLIQAGTHRTQDESDTTRLFVPRTK